MNLTQDNLYAWNQCVDADFQIARKVGLNRVKYKKILARFYVPIITLKNLGR